MLVARSCPTLCDLMDCTACQALLSMGFFRQGFWSGLPFPPQISFFNKNFPTPFSIFNAESNTLHVTDSQQILNVNSHVYAAVSIVCVCVCLVSFQEGMCKHTWWRCLYLGKVAWPCSHACVQARVSLKLDIKSLEGLRSVPKTLPGDRHTLRCPPQRWQDGI